MPKKPPPCLRRNHILWNRELSSTSPPSPYIRRPWSLSYKIGSRLVASVLICDWTGQQFSFFFPPIHVYITTKKNIHSQWNSLYLERYKISSYSGMIMGTTMCLQGVLPEDRLTNSFQFTPDFPMSAMKILHNMKLLIPWSTSQDGWSPSLRKMIN